MAAKRRATSELNHDNWDQTEEGEDPGTFKPVAATELPNRVFAKAKRTLGSSNSSGGGSPFAAFGGFTSGASANPFSFLQKVSGESFGKNSESSEKRENGKQETKSTFFQNTANNSLNKNSLFSEPKQGNKMQQQEPTRMGSANLDLSPSAKAVFGGKTLATESKTERKESASPSPENTEASNSSLSMKTSKEKQTRSIEYYRQLQSLNESLLKWMQLHLSKNACCDFTPVFNDYKKHLDTLNVTYPVKKETLSCKEESDSVFKSPSEKTSKEDNSNANAKSCFKLTNFNLDETDYGAHFSSNTTNTSTFSFGHKTIPVATSSGNTGPTSSSKVDAGEEKKVPPQFSFGLKNVQSSPGKPFSFASTPAVKSSETEGDDAAEYVPPKNDFTAVSEEGAIYSKRCKLFFKKDENFVDKGVGTLHLIPLDGKTQLLVRADTNLGNILLNIILSASLPTSRTGKNNVLLVCVPNPPVDAKAKDSTAIPMLIRVKTSEDADELLEVLEKNKS